MCGIFGFIGKISQDQATACLDTLKHRGPDGAGLWQRADVTLGHRRLSILDLSDNARQPMSYADGRYVITFNGEIYNFVELRNELEARGYRFQSESDTEVVVAAFTAWGEGCLDRFNGMWAFAIWDCREKALFLSRDRFGKKPLFYAPLPGGEFAFASEMKALFPLLGEVRPNQVLVKDGSRMFNYEATDECVIEGIQRFPAGHSGWLRDGCLAKRRWWCTLDHLPAVSTRYEEQVEQFRELFLDACRLRMRSDVPLGTALSGGLDSSATISAMSHIARHGGTQRMGKNWQHAFVASFPGTPLDETEYARMVTDHLGIDATVIEIDPLKAMDDLDYFFYLFEDLYITSPIPFMLTYSAVKNSGISVTLDGHGADELFGGYSFDYLVALRDAGWNLQQAYEIVTTYYDSLPQATPQFSTLPSKTRFIAEQHARQLVRKVLRRRSSASCKDAYHPAWKDLGHLNQQLYISTHETVLPTLLRNYDRYSMANGVEIRMPFMDHRIVCFAFSLPWNSKIRGGFTKAVVRDAVIPYMPHAVARRKTKIGFNSPIVDWMKGPLKDYFLDLIGSRSFKECNLIDPGQTARAIKNVIENHDARFSDGERAWTLLTPYLWERSIFKYGNLGGFKKSLG
jgi:asparagine synthase (glutamine-hydrolysing)